MSDVGERIVHYQQEVAEFGATLVAISKTKPEEDILRAYNAGQKDFGENKVQELCAKYENLPGDIRWHMVGHLQRNKVRHIAPFVHLIHSVDSVRLLEAINKEGRKVDRVLHVLLQVHIAEETTKFGLDTSELDDLVNGDLWPGLDHVSVSGLMGMATHTDDRDKIRSEFKTLKTLFDRYRDSFDSKSPMTVLSMGMSGDYRIALEEGSTMVRIGSAIFGERNYAK